MQLQGILEVTRKGPKLNHACAQVRRPLSATRILPCHLQGHVHTVPISS